MRTILSIGIGEISFSFLLKLKRGAPSGAPRGVLDSPELQTSFVISSAADGPSATTAISQPSFFSSSAMGTESLTGRRSLVTNSTFGTFASLQAFTALSCSGTSLLFLASFNYSNS